MIYQIVLFLLIGVISYFIMEYLLSLKLLSKLNQYIKNKNEKYYEELLKFYEKNKKVNLKMKWNIFHKINIAIDRAGISRNLLVNPISIISFSILCVVFVYLMAFNFFKVVAISCIISVPCFFIPMVILNFMGECKTRKIEKIFLNFLLQLKSYTKINNDILFAMEQVEVMEPLKSHIHIFLIEVNSGIKFEKAIQNLKEKINIDVVRSFFSNIEHCYLYGGNFTELIEKSYVLINEIQTEKNNRMQETRSARFALYTLMFLDIFVYITSIKNNYENYTIMRKTVIGNVILYWNFISLWFLMILASKVKKLDY